MHRGRTLLTRAFALIALYFALPWELQAQTLRVGSTLPPNTLDCQKVELSGEGMLCKNLYIGLLEVDSSESLAPSVARSWTVSPDQRTYRFNLRTDLVWSDGKTLTVQDFVNSWKRILTPSLQAYYAAYLYPIKNAREYHLGQVTNFEQVGVRVINDSTLEVELSEPNVGFLWAVSNWPTFPIRTDLIERYGTLTNSQWARPGTLISSGPYVLTAHEPGRSVTLKKNPLYSLRSGNVQEVRINFTSDELALLKDYVEDRLDVLPYLSIKGLEKLKENSEVVAYPAQSVSFITFNTTKYPANSLQFRRAIAMGFDRFALQNQDPGLLDRYQPLLSMFPPGFMGNGTAFAPPFDKRLAKETLLQGGFDAASLPTIQMVTTNDARASLAKMLKAELESTLQLKVNLVQLGTREFYQQVKTNSPYHIFVNEASASAQLPTVFTRAFTSTGIFRETGWTNAAYDQKIRDFQDPKLREAANLAAHHILTHEYVIAVPLYSEINFALVKPRVKERVFSSIRQVLFKDFSMEVGGPSPKRTLSSTVPTPQGSDPSLPGGTSPTSDSALPTQPEFKEYAPPAAILPKDPK